MTPTRTPWERPPEDNLRKVWCDLRRVKEDQKRVWDDLRRVWGDLTRVLGDLLQITRDLKKILNDLKKVWGDLAGLGLIEAIWRRFVAIQGASGLISTGFGATCGGQGNRMMVSGDFSRV